MKKGWSLFGVFCIFLLVFSLRFMIFSKTAYFSDDESYFTLRQVENIRFEGVPLFYDELSYGGRTHLFSPVYFYLLAGIYFFIPKIFALKIFLNLIASTMVVAVYLISLKLTKDFKAAIVASLISGFIPIFWQESVNSLSILSIILPLTFFTIYFLILYNDGRKYYTHFLVLMFLLILLSASAFILIFGLLLFLVFSKFEKILIKRGYYELILVSLVLYVWFNLILYKNAFLYHGPNVIWQNIPKSYLINYFSEVSIIQAVYLIGLIPILVGIYASYIFMTREKSIEAFVIIGLSFSLFLLLWLKLLPLKIGMIFLGVSLSILVSESLKLIFDYFSMTKFSFLSWFIMSVFLFFIIIAAIIPSYAIAEESSRKKDNLDAYTFLKERTEKDSTILLSQEKGNALAYFSERKNVMDTNYLFLKNVDQRVLDIKRIYTTRFSDEAISLCYKYNINYIIVDDTIRSEYDMDDIFYKDDACFSLVFDNNLKIYKLVCEMNNYDT